jgi:hypothetical protein
MFKSLLPIIIIVIHSCTSNKSEPFTFGNSVLAQIDNHIILKNEFIQRAEYVIRPNYCSKGNNVHKQIVLNSLIAEKLLAIEGEQLFNLDTISNFLNGLKKQSMREKLFFAKSQSNDLGGEALDYYLKIAERTYHLSFITLPRNVVADTLLNINDSAELINDMFDSVEIASRDVSFFSEHNYRLHQAIFSNRFNKHDIIGPLNLEDGTSIIMRVEGWRSERRLSEGSQQEYVRNVKEQLTGLRNIEQYADYIHAVMNNKTLKFNQDSFTKLINNLYYEMLQFENSKKELFRKAIWPENKLVLSGGYTSVNIDKNEIIFNLDGKDWTMSNLQDLINSHPLVFRKKKISKMDFPDAVKNAIADLVRDYYLTQEALELNYDDDPYINQYVNMWREHFIASTLRTKLLQSKSSNTNDIEYLNPIIKELFKKYSDDIQIDLELFDSINLTSIPMHVSNKNAAYQSPIPQFPILTDNHTIDYGRSR